MLRGGALTLNEEKNIGIGTIVNVIGIVAMSSSTIK